MVMWTILFTLIFQVFLFRTALCQGKQRGSTDEQSPQNEPNYYAIYEAIDTLTSLTPHRTFYELLGVHPEASSDEVGRAFRRAALLHHPDKLRDQGKWNARAERLSMVIQFAGNQLRSEQGRREYDWVLNKAPAWHRQTVYVMRKLAPTSKLTIPQVVVIVIGFTVGMQLVAQWISYAVACYMIMSSRSALKRMGEKEVKRIRKRMVGADPSFVAMNNSAYHTILLADSSPPPFPSPLQIWIIQVPLFILQSLVAPLCRKAKTA